MRRIVLVGIVTAVIAAAVLAGLAYAAPPSAPGNTNKLVGIGGVGYGAIGEQDTRWETRVLISNPNTVDTINIDMVRIYDRDGSRLYEGPFLRMFLRGERLSPPYPEVTELQPHQMELMRLSLWTGGVNDAPEVYTVEIFWGGEKNVLPLMGTISQWSATEQSGSYVTNAVSEVYMENMPAR